MKKTTLVILFIALTTSLLLALKVGNKNSVIEFLDSLNDDQLKKVLMPIDHESREAWHFLPAKSWSRKGINLKELSSIQKKLGSNMLKEFLSKSGYTKTQQIIELENVLAELGGNKEYRDPELYFIAIYGNPKNDKLWAWSFEGHHLSLNFTVLNDKVVASPRFFGANPAKITEGNRIGERVLAEEEDLAYKLLDALTDEQKKKAIFQSASLADIVTSNQSVVNPLKEVGIRLSDLDTSQKSILQNLIFVYLSSLPEKIATERGNKVFNEEANDIWFGWAGSANKGEGHYYRIQGKTFLIEFDNTQNNANHIHTVWRDFNGDFGRDLIKEHYKNSDHHKHD